jgi:hypothetical protein
VAVLHAQHEVFNAPDSRPRYSGRVCSGLGSRARKDVPDVLAGQLSGNSCGRSSLPEIFGDDGLYVRWESRHRGLVVFRVEIEAAKRRLPITLHVPRSAFGDGDRELSLFREIGSALVDMARTRRSRQRGAVVARIAFGGARGRVVFQRADLQTFRRIATKLEAEGHDPAEELGLYLYARCCTDFVAELITTTPRRGGIDRRRLTLYLPAAFRAVRALVDQGKKPDLVASRLRARFERTVEDDRELKERLEKAEMNEASVEKALWVGLVARAFRGAKHADAILKGNAENLLRRYAYSSKDLPLDRLLWLKQQYTHERGRRGVVNRYLSWAEDVFLGVPGAAAATYRLGP